MWILGRNIYTQVILMRLLEGGAVITPLHRGVSRGKQPRTWRSLGEAEQSGYRVCASHSVYTGSSSSSGHSSLATQATLCSLQSRTHTTTAAHPAANVHLTPFLLRAKCSLHEHDRSPVRILFTHTGASCSSWERRQGHASQTKPQRALHPSISLEHRPFPSMWMLRSKVTPPQSLPVWVAGQTPELCSVIPILWMGRLRPREEKGLARLP